ncbi:MAG: tRNA lysidine(34) synthetase TilS [Holosporales bacterium]|jgi:tRNA(Ile)-lysidine synthase|nr:tRNA lysidine(34) synthetase TilS [Holosporales bacterium]
MVISDSLFAEYVDEIRGEKRWVVALSGGADSLCLTLLANDYATKYGIKLYAGIVDHRLRPESSEEILPIIEILEANHIGYRVLVWHHDIINGSVEKKAREARYDLLYDYCRKLNCKVLMTAHHALDQWETFFMRLVRGSASKGLACMKSISNFNGISLVRPFLEFNPYLIKHTLRNRFHVTKYLEDPSNKQCTFERVRWRGAYGDLSKKYSLSIKNVNKSIKRLQRATEVVDQLVEKTTSELFDGKYIDICKFRVLALELKIRTLESIIISLRGLHIISYSLLERTACKICVSSFTATNLCGLILKRDKNKNIKVTIENRKKSH